MDKAIKEKQCPICETMFKPLSTTQRVDKTECALIFNKRKDNHKAKAKERKVDLLRKKVFRASDLKLRKKAAKMACHKFIRERDKGNLCICCDRPLGDKFDAGHYMESNNNPLLRYNEDNIHAQSVYCNQYKGGNSDDYRGNLIRKIGIERVETLELKKGKGVKRTCDDYAEIEKHYKDKLKQLTINGI